MSEPTRDPKDDDSTEPGPRENADPVTQADAGLSGGEGAAPGDTVGGEPSDEPEES